MCGCDRLIFGDTQYMDWHLNDVLQHRHMGPEIEMLEDHGELGAQALQLLGIFGHQFTGRAGNQCQLFTCNIDAPLVGLFQHVDAAQKSTFAGAGTSDDADHIAGMGGQRNAFEHLVAAEAFVDVLNLEFQGLVIGHVLSSRIRFSRGRSGN